MDYLRPTAGTLDVKEMVKHCGIPVSNVAPMPVSVVEGRYRIRNISDPNVNLYLGVQTSMIGQNNGSLALEKLDRVSQNVLESSQV